MCSRNSKNITYSITAAQPRTASIFFRLSRKNISTVPFVPHARSHAAAFSWSPSPRCDSRPERRHSLVRYFTCRLCLHRSLSGLVAGGWDRIQPMRKEKAKSKKKKGEKEICHERMRGIWVKRTVWGRAGGVGEGWCGQRWVLGVIIPITWSTVSCSVDGGGLSTHTAPSTPCPSTCSHTHTHKLFKESS